LRRNRRSELVGVDSWPPCQVLEEDQPSVAGRLGFCIIHSPYSIWLAILCVLLAMMLTGYSFVSDRYADVSTIGASTEDPEAIIVSGTTAQQRDAALTNFTKYGTGIGESTTLNAKTLRAEPHTTFRKSIGLCESSAREHPRLLP
jgi:hypothetical protein